jgi:PAS domain S-box-containing protein/putative nucleotidyltransferase with HDIG domain
MTSKVLLVENDIKLAKVIQSNLKRFGYSTYPTITRGELVLPFIDKERPDIIILDLQLPGKVDGNILAHRIHQEFEIPFIFLTDSSQTLLDAGVRESNPYGFVLKDFDAFRFPVVIEIALEKFNTEKQLRENEDRFRTIANFTYDWEYWLDEFGKFVYISPSVERVSGYKVVEFGNDTSFLLQIVHPDDAEMFQNHIDQLSNHPGQREIIFRIIKKDGNIRWIRHVCQPVNRDDGSYRGLYATNHDITDQVDAELTLKKSEQRYTSFFEDTRIPLWVEDLSGIKSYIESLRKNGIQDVEGYFLKNPEKIGECISLIKVLDVNQAGLKLSRATSKELLLGSLTPVTQKIDASTMLEEIIAIANGAIAFDGEGINYDRKGNLIYVQVHWSVPPESVDQYSRVLVSIMDVTSRRKREHSLEAISNLSAAVRVAKTQPEMLNVLNAQIAKLFETAGCAIILATGIKGKGIVEFASGIFENLTGNFVSPSPSVYHDILNGDKPYTLDNNQVLSDMQPLTRDSIQYTRMLFPLKAEQQILGLLLVARSIQFSETEKELLQSLVNILAVALFRTNLLDKTRTYAEHMATISNVGIELTRTLNIIEVYEHLSHGVLQILQDVSTIFISSFDPENHTVSYAYGIDKNVVLDTAILPPFPLDTPNTVTQSEVIHTGDPLIVNDIQQKISEIKSQFKIDRPGLNARSGVYIPLIVRDEVLGVLQVLSEKLNRFTQSDIELLIPLANIGAIAIKNSRLFTQTEERLKRLTVLHTVDLAVSSNIDLRVTVNILVDELISIPHFKATDILIYEPARQVLEYSVGRGFISPANAVPSIRLGEGLAGKAALEGKVKTWTATGNSPDIESPTQGRIASGCEYYAAIPLISKGQIKGVLEVFGSNPRIVHLEWLEFLETLAGQVGIAIDNSLLVNQLQRSNLELTLAYDLTLEGWSKALDLRDKETQDHSRDVTALAVQLAEAMGLTGMDVVQIQRGALLHDIGKMGIPDEILLKGGPLTPAEWKIMKKHPVFAYEMLSPITFLSQSLDIPYCHHEHWNGEGYPRGLMGEQIPLAARIFAIADVFQALTSNRPYRFAWTKERALQQIKIESGTHLDPAIVDVFLRMME